MVAESLIAGLAALGKKGLDLLNAKDDAERARIFADFQRELANAQADKIALGAKNIEIAEELSAKKAECLKLKEWEADKSRYRLVNPGATGFVYALKQSHSDTDPPHWICANCYARGSKSFLHTENNGGWPKIQCTVCNTAIPTGTRLTPDMVYAVD
jgi:hypothetical protein